MIKGKSPKPAGYWTYDRCKKEALKYKSRTDFKLNSGSAYTISNRNKWTNNICDHMFSPINPSGYWNFERCKVEALKHKTKTSFEKKSKGAYMASKRNGWYKDITEHMEYLPGISKRMIYCFEFSNNYVYVGLTCNLNRRISQHLNDEKSSVFKHIKKTGSKYVLKKLTEYVLTSEAKENEEYFLQKYLNEGWSVLNKAKTGGVGVNTLIWDYEKCKEAASKFNDKSSFLKTTLAHTVHQKHTNG